MFEGLDIPKLCSVAGCQRTAQVYSLKSMFSNGKNSYLKTCCRHTYKELKHKYIAETELMEENYGTD
jgi:hypothetical protein